MPEGLLFSTSADQFVQYRSLWVPHSVCAEAQHRREDVKKRMLAAIRRSNNQFDPEAVKNMRTWLDGIRRSPAL